MARRGTFAFDPSKPAKRGRLLKQGAFHKAFKSREFVLYPGYLVYYDNENTWRLDITKGQTLGGRQGAVKLKGATVEIARNAPKGCKYGLLVTAPHPANKRQQYLMNASSKEDRDSWIEAIRNASPCSPQMKPKSAGVTKPTEDPKPVVKSSEAKEERLKPSPVERQTTATDAAVIAAMNTDRGQEEKQIEEMAASVTGSLKGIEGMMKERHNTATMAALSLHIDESLENGTDDAFETNIDSLLEVEEDDPIDTVLGAQENEHKSSEESSVSTDSNSRVISPFSDGLNSPMLAETENNVSENINSEQLDSLETVQKSESDEGEVTITTSVTVSCTSLDGPAKAVENGTASSESGSQNGGDNSQSEPNGETEEGQDTKLRTCTSTQVLISDTTPTISVNLSNYDSDDTLSDEESVENLEDVKKKVPEQNGDSGTPPPATPPATTGESTISSITVKEDRTGSNSSAGSNNSSHLSTPQTTRRRSSSTPFIEKRGFLYKMGGKRKSWKLRYFVLRPGAFQYFKDPKCQKMLGEVKLKNVKVFFPGVGERKQSFQFTVHTESSWNNRPDYVLAAQSEREMKEWITAFKLASGQKVSTPPDSDEGSQ